jgi:6-phosphofructokinase 1
MRELGLTSRFDKPGTLQRMSMLCASEVDLDEAWLVGAEATRRATAGQTDLMVTLLRENRPDGKYAVTTGVTPLLNIANSERKMPPGFINPAGNFVTEAYLEYARPLIGGPLPEYLRLARGNLIPKEL